MKLLYRSEQYVDESFSGYLARLSYWNGFNSENIFISWLHRIYKELFYCCEMNNDESLLAEINRERNISRWHKCRISLEAILGRSFSWSEMNLGEATRTNFRIAGKICSLCWDETPYMRFYWEDNRYTVCHKHDVLLLPMRNISYSPKFNIDNSVDKYEKINRKSNCEITRIFLKGLRGQNCNKNILRTEKSVASNEFHLWKHVIRFLKERFFISFEFENIFESIDRESLFGLPVVERIEKVRKLLVFQRPEYEKLINIVIILYVRKSGLLFPKSKKNWVASEAYSLNPVFYSYIFGVGQHLFAGDGGNSSKVMPPIPFLKFSDRMLCKFILESSILSHSDLLSIQHTGKNFNTGRCEALGVFDDQVYDYGSYIEAAGNNIFDRKLCRRSELPELS
ncbi:TniQ family protein [Marinagarivorans algicola]|uniref:TniQ family protein n=1 Tax=Marinagarivorans algicola TaxID=1513270 RepID=UPI0006B53F9D|nr:TniQ family protein [Marinagarivorans algicola]